MNDASGDPTSVITLLVNQRARERRDDGYRGSPFVPTLNELGRES
jgi:hypothetical protein